jgi:hypothetical protein
MFQVEVTDDELRILCGCINEALALHEAEFHARVGADKEEARAFFHIMAAARAARR